MRYKRLFLPVSVLLLGILWSACVDIPSDPGTNVNPNYRSLVRFVHAVPGGPSGDVKVDGASVGTLSFPSATAYLDVASGSRSVAFGSASAQTISFGSEQQSTILVYSTGAGVSYLNLVEGHKDKNNGTAGVALVKFVNVAQGSAANLAFKDTTVAGTELAAGVAFGRAPAYAQITSRSHTVVVVSNGSYTVTLNGASEVPPVTTPSAGSGTVTLTASGGVVYSVDVKSDNSQGFYTGGHFHNAAAGANGPVVHAINVSGQRISIPQVTLSGANEVPAAVTAASGTASFTLTPAGLTYTVTATRDTVDTLFTASHFHNGAAGANGPIWHTIHTGRFGDTTLAGTWAGAALGDTLKQLLAGRIYVNIHSVKYPGGVIRAQLVPDAFTTNTYAGTWNDTSLTNALKQEFNTGRIYINFHTTTNASGQIRGQVTVGEQYGVASLPSSSFDAGRMYTVVASGAGSSLQLVKLSDRQAGLSKTATVLGAHVGAKARE